jgi:predicted peroxiredoxin
MPRLLINCTHGKEDPERATLPFVVGNVAASADQEAVVLLTIEGVRNATKGYADTICKEGFQPLKEVMQSFVANGGQIWACGACAKPAASPRQTWSTAPRSFRRPASSNGWPPEHRRSASERSVRKIPRGAYEGR